MYVIFTRTVEMLHKTNSTVLLYFLMYSTDALYLQLTNE